MSWQDRALSMVRRYGPAVKFAAKVVLGAVLPGSPAVVDLVEGALGCVQETAKDVHEIRRQDQLRASPEDQRRLDEVFAVLGGDLSSLVAQVSALESVPAAAVQIVNTAVATDERVQGAVSKLDELAKRFDRLEQQNREILKKQGYAADILEEMLPLLRRQASVAPWVEELNTAGITAVAFRQMIESVQRMESAFSGLRFDEAASTLSHLREQRPVSAAAHIAGAAVQVAKQDLPSAELELINAAKINPQDLELVALRDRVTRATRGLTPSGRKSEAAGPRVGDSLDGWALEALLGQGGWGQVFKAKRNNQTVALKVMRPDLSREKDFVERFKREIMSLCGLRGTKHVVDILDFGKDDTSGSWYFAMELIEGSSLERYLTVKGPLTVGQARGVFLAVAEGLGVAHTRGVVHRDVKPANILLRQGGAPVLVDFGIATQADSGNTKLAGYTALFASPEQLRGRHVDVRSDVYSLGASLWYSLMFDKEDLREPDRFDTDACPEELRDLLSRALHPRADKRHENAAAFREQLATRPKPPAPPKPAPAPVPILTPVAPKPVVAPVVTAPPVIAPLVNRGPLREYTNSIGMKLVLVEAGKFTMGSPSNETGRSGDETQHEVTISTSFYMSVFMVTQGQWKAVMGTTPSSNNKTGTEIDWYPVENVTYIEVQEFMKKMQRLAPPPSGGTYRLPTEAEWEYACRGGPQTTNKPFLLAAPCDSLNSNQANFDGKKPYNTTVQGPAHFRSTRVDAYPPSRLGLYDMHGNVCEWVQDWTGSCGSSPVTDPQGPSSESIRVYYLRKRGYLGEFAIFEGRNSANGVEAFEEEVDHANLAEGLAALGGTFIVLAEATIVTQPGVGAFDHPTAGHLLEGLALTTYHHDLVLDIRSLLPVPARTAVILVVRPDCFQSAGRLPRQLAQQTRGLHSLVEVGCRHQCSQKEPLAAHNDMSFAPLDTFVAIDGALVALVVGSHGLTVNGSGFRFGITARLCTCFATQDIKDLQPSAILLPGLEVIEDGALLEQVVGNVSPLTTRPGNVQYRVHYLAQVHCAFCASAFRPWQQRLDLCPLLVRQVAGVSCSALHGYTCLFRLSLFPPSTSMQISFPDRLSGSSRVYRSACYLDGGNNCRASFRNARDPASKYAYLGFRVVLAMK